MKEVNKLYKRNNIVIQDNINRRCDICYVGVHRASYAKHLTSMKH